MTSLPEDEGESCAPTTCAPPFHLYFLSSAHFCYMLVLRAAASLFPPSLPSNWLRLDSKIITPQSQSIDEEEMAKQQLFIKPPPPRFRGNNRFTSGCLQSGWVLSNAGSAPHLLLVGCQAATSLSLSHSLSYFNSSKVHSASKGKRLPEPEGFVWK